MQPLISVVMPVYNCCERMELMLDSLEKQDYQPFELVIVDDGSTDATPEALRELSASGRFDRLKVLGDGANHGVSWARNVGFDASEGAYLIFLDADDVLPPDYLTRLKDLITVSGADYAACGFREYDAKTDRYEDHPLEIPDGLSPEALLAGCLTERYGLGYLWAVLFRRSYLARHNLRSHVGCSATQDRELLLKALACLGRGAFTPDPLYVYVQHDGMSRRRNNTSPEKRFRRYHDKAYAELREANFVLHRVADEGARTAARCWLKTSAFHRILAMHAMTGRRDRFDRLVGSKPMRSLLWSSFIYPPKCLRSAMALLLPGLYYAHYSDAKHAVAPSKRAR